MAHPTRSEDGTIVDVLALDPHRFVLRAELQARPVLGNVYTLSVFLDPHADPEGTFRLVHHRHGDWYLGEQESGRPAPSVVCEAITSRLADAWPEELAP